MIFQTLTMHTACLRVMKSDITHNRLGLMLKLALSRRVPHARLYKHSASDTAAPTQHRCRPPHCLAAAADKTLT